MDVSNPWMVQVPTRMVDVMIDVVGRRVGGGTRAGRTASLQLEVGMS
jgi:hypothetical protein